jgi:Ras-related protein Rab-5C
MASSVINYCIIGIFASGKTSLAASFIKNRQSVTNESTIGASFIVNYTQVGSGQIIRLNIWDTAGQERYAALLPMYSRNADVIIFTIDPVNPDSVPYIKKMMPIVMSDSIMAIHLVVTKMDMQYNDEVARELVADVRAFLHKEYDVVVNDYYTSAMTCYNVEQPFITNCDEIIRQKVERNSIKLDVDLVENVDLTNRNRCGYC